MMVSGVKGRREGGWRGMEGFKYLRGWPEPLVKHVTGAGAVDGAVELRGIVRQRD